MNEVPEGQDDLSKRLAVALQTGDIIRNGRLLPERELCARLSIGRYGLRRALQRLEVDGLIWRRQGQGTFLSTMHPPPGGAHKVAPSPAEIMEARIELEPILARFCALRASSEQVRRIALNASVAEKATTLESFELADYRFHRSIAEGANNATFLAMADVAIAALQKPDWQRARRSTFSQARRLDVHQEHETIVAAIVDRNPRRSEQRMRHHLQSIMQHLQRRNDG